MESKRILLDHGSGGLATQTLIDDILIRRLDNPVLSELGDSAILNLKHKGRLAFTTDSYVVDPIFFPGGNIGELAVNGTVNDLAMVGARPLYISLGLILEEGLLVEDLEHVVDSVAQAAKKAGVSVVTGDTKVVPKGKGDKVFINTSGVGVLPEGVNISVGRARPGDAVICSGSIADHGVTILTCRAGLDIQGDLKSDTQPLNYLVEAVLDACPGAVRSLRDPTRGGLGTTLREIASKSNVIIEIDESTLPIKDEVASVCDLLGMDPLFLANEGKCVVIVHEPDAEKVLQVMRSVPEGREARIIGRVLEGAPDRVVLKTAVGGLRIVEPPSGELLPRIC